jgi:glycine/D-amino acid oxidase-like deaminating enzyme
MQNKRIAIIGGGIAAYGMAHEFISLQNKHEFDVTLYDGSHCVPPCSLSSTAITALRGTTKGISPLGDLMVDAYYAFEKFYNEYKPDGVSETIEEHLWQMQILQNEKMLKRHPSAMLGDSSLVKNKEKLFRATEKAYVIVPELFLAWYAQQVQDFVTIKNEMVAKIEKKENLYLINNAEYDAVIFCTGYKSSWFRDFFTSPNAYKKMSHAKPVAGTYLSFDESYFDKLDFKNNLNESFSIAYESYHLIYQKEAKRILVGSTTNNLKEDFLPDPKIQEIYHQLRSSFDWSKFPNYEDAQIHTGIRHKGQQRTPFWGKIDDQGAYAIHSLYKNGYSFYLLAADGIVEYLRQ